MQTEDYIKQTIIEAIQTACSTSGLPIDPSAVKELADETLPEAPYGVTVEAADQGNHLGIPGRILVDATARIHVWTHLDEDPDAAICKALNNLVDIALSSLAWPTGNGWKVKNALDWHTDAITQEGIFRTALLSADIYLQKE